MYGNQEKRMTLLDQCCLLGRTPGSELGCDLVRTKLLTEIDSFYQPQSSKISEKQRKNWWKAEKTRTKKVCLIPFQLKNSDYSVHIKVW